ncbi:MAG TPA: P-II family nitrogen regulator [Candidatus Acidoferrum sp.]|nr:P-II family nitrogen regulator [Candidatus Acidoferrum sp.]
MSDSIQMILAVVNRGFADEAMDAAREAGAAGGTIIHAKGTGDGEDTRFYGITIQHEKEMLLILARACERKAIMQAVAARVGMRTPGQGIVFSLPVSGAVGLTAQYDCEDEDENERPDGDVNP